VSLPPQKVPAQANARGGFWTFKTLAARNQTENIIEGFSPNGDERASYNLSVGEEIYITPSSPNDGKSRELLKEKESRAIPPGQFALMHSEEKVNIPKNAIAFITLRSKQTKFRGLVNVSGFHVEPGYSGKLVFSVFNAGPAPIHVARGDKWFEIFFADLDNVIDQNSIKKGYEGIPTELVTPLSDRFHSLPGLDKKIDDAEENLSERIQKLERESSILRWSQGLILGAFITLALKSCSYPDANSNAIANAAQTHSSTMETSQ
jgi:dCTP deaminase